MDVNTRTEANYNIVSLVGEVDLHCSPQAREEILSHLKNKQPVLVELIDVTYIDSSGIASLVEGYQLAKAEGLNFGLVNVSDAVMQVLQLARLDKVFPIHASINDVINK